MEILKAIQTSCSCTEQEAQEYLDGELRYLRELAAVNDLRCDDVRQACDNLGIGQDYQFYFITLLI